MTTQSVLLNMLQLSVETFFLHFSYLPIYFPGEIKMGHPVYVLLKFNEDICIYSLQMVLYAILHVVYITLLIRTMYDSIRYKSVVKFTYKQLILIINSILFNALTKLLYMMIKVCKNVIAKIISRYFFSITFISFITRKFRFIYYHYFIPNT